MESNKTLIGIGTSTLPKPSIMLIESQIGDIDHTTCPNRARISITDSTTPRTTHLGRVPIELNQCRHCEEPQRGDEDRMSLP